MVRPGILDPVILYQQVVPFRSVVCGGCCGVVIQHLMCSNFYFISYLWMYFRNCRLAFEDYSWAFGDCHLWILYGTYAYMYSYIGINGRTGSKAKRNNPWQQMPGTASTGSIGEHTSLWSSQLNKMTWMVLLSVYSVPGDVCHALGWPKSLHNVWNWNIWIKR